MADVALFSKEGGRGWFTDLLTRNYQSSSLVSKQFVKQLFYFLIVLNLCLIPVFVYLQKIVDCGWGRTGILRGRKGTLLIKISKKWN